MNYYQFHLGDYAVSTRGLSWDEHCAYRMLIDLYYAREEPISLDRQRVYRQTMARTKRQKTAIDQILAARGLGERALRARPGGIPPERRAGAAGRHGLGGGAQGKSPAGRRCRAAE